MLFNLDNAESRRVVENCYRTSKVLINPLIDWDDDFVWWYIKHEEININPLYQCGNTRIGCIGCPMAGKKRWKEFERYQKYRDAYIRAFGKMLKERERRGLENKMGWDSALKVFKWWMQDDAIDGQLRMDEFGNIYEEFGNDDRRFL